MGKEARLKEVRKQLRNIVNENFAELAKNEMYSKLQEEVRSNLELIRNDVTAQLKAMDDRQRDVHNYVLRELTSGLPKVEAPQSEGSPEATLTPAETA